MSSQITVPPTFHNTVADPAFQQSKVDPRSLAEGVGQAFPVLSIRGKVFRLKYRGEERPILNSETGQPVQSLDVIILKASPVISKIFYETQFVEGQREAPDCWSTNGITPDPAAPKKQHNFCASCPQNLWGSKVVNNKAAKACQDNKRLAVVPAHDPRNELFGGPMLLRIPPASLQDMSAYQVLVQQYGQQYFTTITQLSFDFDVAHPKIKFAPVAPITGSLAQLVVELQDHPQVQRMLAEGVEFVKGEEGDPPGGAVNVQQQRPVAQPAPPPPPMPPPAVPAATQPAMPDPPAFLVRPQPAVVPGITPPPPQTAPPVVFGPSPTVGGQSTAEVVAGTIAGQIATVQTDAIAMLQKQLLDMQAQLAAAQAPKPRKRSNPPPSPTPTAAAGIPNQPVVAASPSAGAPAPAAGIVMGAPQPNGAQVTQDPAEVAGGFALPEGMDQELDQLLHK